MFDLKIPSVNLVGESGDIFHLIGLVSKELQRAGLAEQAKEMSNRIISEAESYYHALRIIMEYVEVE